jgi:hypothetical protein
LKKLKIMSGFDEKAMEWDKNKMNFELKQGSR